MFYVSVQRIALTNGMEALVDDEDVALVSAYRWIPSPMPTGQVYAMAHVKQQDGKFETVYMHRLVAGCKKGDGIIIDHINRRSLDNRRSNLRKCDKSLNARNSPGHAKRKSRFKGVKWNPHVKHYYACIRWKGNFCYIGCFKDEEDAAIAYNVAVQILIPGPVFLNDV